MIVFHVIGMVFREIWWWLSGLIRLIVHHLAFFFLFMALVGVVWIRDARPVLALVIVPIVGMALWARIGPVSYQRQVSDRLWRQRTGRWMRKTWPTLMDTCGLSRRVPATPKSSGMQVPGLKGLGWSDGQLVASPVLLTGQTVDDVEGAAERLRVSVQARRVRIVPNPALTGCQIVWTFGDPLAAPFDASVPALDAEVAGLDAVALGRTEDGDVWWLTLGVSTLVAGTSGSGKASLIWGLVFGVAPAIRSGLVQVHGIDLKGGMEFTMGQGLFTRYAQTPERAVVLLEDTVTAMQTRAAKVAGHTRQVKPSLEHPMVLVLVDELAALVGYLPDRDLLKRAEAALSLLCSQGRAVGFFVFGFLQDPRKETVKMRHLFPQTLGLRLKERDEVAMVLGEGAIAAGAACHKIPRSTPGVGYVINDEDGHPVKVRAGYVSDDMIRSCAERFPAAEQQPIMIPEPDPDEVPRSTSRRKTASRRKTTSAPEKAESVVGSESA